MALKQIQQLKQQLKLTPQQIQLLKLIQLPVTALEQKIQEELEINPALDTIENSLSEEPNQEEEETFTQEDSSPNETDEEKEPAITKDDVDMEDYMDWEELDSYKYASDNYSSDSEKNNDFFNNNIAVSSVSLSLNEILTNQLEMQNFNEVEYQIAEYLIGCIDDDGYVRRELQSVVNDLLFMYNINASIQEVQKVLKTIQTFDPPGIAATSLQDCLLIQLNRKKQTASNQNILTLAITIIEKYFDEFTKKHYDKILYRLHISEDIFKQAIQEITHLNPKPGYTEASERTISVYPDFLVTIIDGKPELTLNNGLLPELTISKEYIDLLNEYGKQKEKSAKEASKFIKTKIEEAKWFIDALQQRERILLGALYEIVQAQKEFFTSGDKSKIKPLLLKDIASKINADISTVSRIVNSKYVLTPYGTYSLKFFFSESMTTDSGEEVSNKEIKQFIQDAIAYENKRSPLTDDELCELLKKKGYNIARRTVAKYREQLNISVARLRKEI